MTTDDTPIETSEAEARPWKPSDGYLPAGADEHPALQALDRAFAEIRWRNEGVRDRLRGAFVRQIAAAPIIGWHIRMRGCDGSADWIELGPERPTDVPDEADVLAVVHAEASAPAAQPATAPAPARWYCLSRIGMATLCLDEADAKRTAVCEDDMHPLNGPHRAVRMVEVASQPATAPVVPAGHVVVPSPITESMHVAACKVLTRAAGLDGTPQRMLDSLVAAAPAAQQGEAVAPTRADLIAALKFYATGEHFILSEPAAWDTVSGEPQNWQCDEAGTATVEDGWIAKATLEGRITAEQIEALEDGETLDDATQPAAAPQPVAQGVTMTDVLIDRFESACIERHITGDPESEFEHRAHDHARDAYDAARAALAAAPAGVVGEAVASIYISPNGEREMDDWRHALPVGRNILYTAPPARQALSQKAVVEAFCKLPHQVQYVCTFEAGVRFAERAHDIGG